MKEKALQQITRFSLCIAILITSITQAANSKIEALDLNNNWTLARVPDIAEKGELISTVNYKTKDWINATVPGTVLTSYEDQGLISDPYYSDNMEKLSQKYYNVDYWYRTQFTVPETFTKEKIWLNFDAINWKAEIYLNGKKLGNIEGAFRRGHFDITNYVTANSTNALAVKIIWSDARSTDAPAFICSAGWDWMPPIPGRNIGIYQDVYLTNTGTVKILDPFIITDLPLPNTSSADLTIKVDVKNYSDKPTTGTLKGSIKSLGVEFEKNINLNGHETRNIRFGKNEFKQLTVKNPKLWWPNGYGDQTLHQLELEFVTGKDQIDSENVTFGVREYTYDMNGHDLYLEVNGTKVMCKGGNWGMPDAMLKWSKQDYETALSLHKDMNLTMIRTWHGTSDLKDFYDACDKYGIMVFEDFWMNGWIPPKDTQSFLDSAKDKFKRLRNRACVAVWCGENEAYLTEPLLSEIPRLYNKYDGTRHYFGSSVNDGVHGHGPYAIQDPAWYFGFANGFTTEIGSPCVPSVESMRMMMDEKDLWPIGKVWAWHDWDADIGNKQPERYTAELNKRYGNATGIEDYCQKAQLVNIETFKAIFESWNDQLWDDCSGVLLWMTQSVWPSTIWQTYDYYFEGTGAYYAIKNACEPIHIQWNMNNGSIKAINLTSAELKGLTVEAEVYNMDGSLVHQEKVSNINLKSNTAKHCIELLNPNGNNLAINKKALSSSTEGEHKAENVSDGHLSSRWSSDYKDPQWVHIDLGEKRNIDSVIINWEGAFAKSYELRVSDDAKNWKTVYSTDNGDGGYDKISFEPTEARYIMMYGKQRGSMYGYSIFEIIVNETGSSPETIKGLSDVHFIKLRLNDSNNKLLSENFYWRGNKHLEYQTLEKMLPTNLKYSATNRISGNKSTIKTTIKNDSDKIAFSIRLKLMKGNTGQRVLPAIYEDNYFSLLPGEKKDIEIEFDTKLLGKEKPKLIVEGWNIDTQEIKIK